MAQSKLKIEYCNPADLLAYPGNARVHPESQIEEIVASIQEFGFVKPVGIDENGMILTGHGSTVAAIRLELPEIPTVSLAHLSDRQKRAWILADNRIAQNSTWDMEKLSAEVDALADLDQDLSILGFDEAELEALLKDAAFLPESEPVAGERIEGKKSRSKASGKILHTCPNCKHEFTAE